LFLTIWLANIGQLGMISKDECVHVTRACS